MRKPPTREGEVWLDQYTSTFTRWARSSYADTAAFAEAVSALQMLLQRCPDYAAEVERIASIACFASRRGHVPTLIIKLAECGLEAGAIATAGDRPSKPSAILLLSLAEAELIAERRLAGLDALHRLQQRLEGADADDPVEYWITGRMHALFGELHELGREEEQARRSYAAAFQEIEPLLEDSGKQEAFLDAWAKAISEQPIAKGLRSKALDAIALLELKTLAASSAIGVSRSVGAGASHDERAAAARQAWKALEACGPPPDLSPFDVIPVIGALPPDEAERFGAALIASVEQRRLQLQRCEVPPGITHPDAIAVVQRAEQQQSKLLEKQRAVYELVGKLGVAVALRAEGDLAQAEKMAVAAIQAAIATRLGGPQVCAFGLGFEITAARDRKHGAKLLDLFTLALAGTMQSDPKFFASVRIRALLDGAIATAAGMILEQSPGNGEDAQVRRRASVVLDLLRRPDLPLPELLVPKGASKSAALGREAGHGGCGHAG